MPISILQLRKGEIKGHVFHEESLVEGYYHVMKETEWYFVYLY